MSKNIRRREVEWLLEYHQERFEELQPKAERFLESRRGIECPTAMCPYADARAQDSVVCVLKRLLGWNNVEGAEDNNENS